MAAEWMFHSAMGKVQNDQRHAEQDDDGAAGEKDDREEARLVRRSRLEVIGDLFQTLRNFLQVLVKLLLEPMGVIVLVAHVGLDAAPLADAK